MTKQPGRKMLLKKDGTAIAGVRQVGFTVNGSSVNVEDQSDSGLYTALAGVKIGRRIEISVEGYEDGNILRDISMASDASEQFFTDLTVETPEGDVLSGPLILENYTETGSFEDGVTFSATIGTNGAWTFTKAT